MSERFSVGDRIADPDLVDPQLRELYEQDVDTSGWGDGEVQWTVGVGDRPGFWGWFWIIAFGVLIGSTFYLSCIGVG